MTLAFLKSNFEENTPFLIKYVPFKSNSKTFLQYSFMILNVVGVSSPYSNTLPSCNKLKGTFIIFVSGILNGDISATFGSQYPI